jgi:deoxycytidylate deaminase
MTEGNMKNITYPYLPDGREIKYVPVDNKFMKAASKLAQTSGCRKQSTAAVIVRDGEIIAQGSNSGIRVEICPRVEKGSKTGTDYHFCKEICQQEGHAEEMAIKVARKKGLDTKGADLYLFGHWWCCKPCWEAMESAGIKNVYLQEGSEVDFAS